MSRKFRPLFPDLGIKLETRCYKCGQIVDNVDYDSMFCRDCFDTVKPPGMKARWIALTYLVIFAIGFGTYYGIYKLITFLY